MYQAIKFPERTRAKTKEMFLTIVDSLVLNNNQVPARLNQRHKDYTKELVEAFKKIALTNPNLFVLNKASPKDRYKEAINFGGAVYRPCTTLSLSYAYFSYLKQYKPEIMKKLKDSGKETDLKHARLVDYFASHVYTIDGEVKESSVTRGENGRIYHTLTSEKRSSTMKIVKSASSDVISLAFEMNNLEWSIDGDSDLSVCDFKACKPTVLSSIYSLPFSGTYPEISGIPRDIMKRICAAVSNGATQPLRIKEIKESINTQMSNKEIVEIVKQVIPVYGLDIKEINKKYSEIETRMLLDILSRCKTNDFGVIPLHDGLICRSVHAKQIAEIMEHLGEKYSLRVDVTKLTSKLKTEIRTIHKK